MVAVDGAGSAPTTRLRRLLRRGLLVAALAVAAWLLSALFANSASAAPAPPPDPDEDVAWAGAPTTAEPSHTGLGSLLGGVTKTLTSTVANVVTSTVTHVVTPAVHQVDHPVATLTSAVVGTAEQVLAPAARPEPAPAGAARAATPKPASPHRPPAIPALPSTVALAAEHTPRAPAAAIPRTSTTSRQDTGEHAGRPGPEHPIQTPAPVAPGGTSVSSSYDNVGGARAMQGMPTAADTLPPTAAGYTTRSRTADATGRVAGLPAISPD